jgi:hypothetical protein
VFLVLGVVHGSRVAEAGGPHVPGAGRRAEGDAGGDVEGGEGGEEGEGGLDVRWGGHFGCGLSGGLARGGGVGGDGRWWRCCGRRGMGDRAGRFRGARN